MSAGTAPYPPAGASFTLVYDPIMRARISSSYEIRSGPTEAIPNILARKGWRRVPGNTLREVARLHQDRGPIVLYTASVLVQGDARLRHAALAPLVEEPRR